ncbi:MAG TPA: ABC transporter permease [Nitrososphaerales archaeon]|nr:ABC transporter permease [Nitrososphaerales archaeon]
MRETRLILRDLKGARFRTAAIVVSVAVLVSLLFSTSVFDVGARRVSAAGAGKFGADIMLLSPTLPTIFSYETATGPIFVVDRPEGYMNSSVVGQVLSLPGVDAASPQVFVAILNRSGTGATPRLVAFDPATDFVVQPWLSRSIADLQPNDAIVGAAAGFSVGDEVRYQGLVLKVVAVLSSTNASLDQTVLFPIETLRSTPGITTTNEISAVMVKLSDSGSLTTVESELKNNVGSFRVVAASGLVTRVRVDTAGIASYELLAEVIMAASVFSLIGLVFTMTTNERSRQLGLMRSIGATNRFIFANVLKEAALTAAIGSGLGLLLGAAVVYLGEGFLVATFNTVLTVPDFSESLILVLTSVGLGIAIGTAASLLPAWRVSRRDPYEAIRKGE